MKGLSAVFVVLGFFVTGNLAGTNSICTDFNYQYTTLSTSIKNIIADYIESNSMQSYEDLAVGTKQAIGGILTNNSLNPSDQAILTNFYNYEISPGTSATMCIVRYILD
ncbi:hypothetical protein ACKWTF_000859 [Chironomus riparius]